MKKINKQIFTILLLCSIIATYAQQNIENKKNPKYEISVDFLKFVKPYDTATIEGSFEYLLNESESLSITPSFHINDYSIGVAYKHYFSKKYAQGFFTALGSIFQNGKTLTRLTKDHIII